MGCEKTIEGSRFTLRYPVIHEFLNNEGNMHGGEIVKILDEAAGHCAARYSEGHINTAAFHNVSLIRPLRPANLMHIDCRVIATGTSSMLVELDLYEEALDDRRTLCAKAHATFVALNKDRSLRQVPTLIYTDDEEKKRCLEIKKLCNAFRNI